MKKVLLFLLIVFSFLFAQSVEDQLIEKDEKLLTFEKKLVRCYKHLYKLGKYKFLRQELKLPKNSNKKIIKKEIIRRGEYINDPMRIARISVWKTQKKMKKTFCDLDKSFSSYSKKLKNHQKEFKSLLEKREKYRKKIDKEFNEYIKQSEKKIRKAFEEK